jgi:hypothetical protein
MTALDNSATTMIAVGDVASQIAPPGGMTHQVTEALARRADPLRARVRKLTLSTRPIASAIDNGGCHGSLHLDMGKVERGFPGCASVP